MHPRPVERFPQSDLRRIEQAVLEAERDTSGELVVCIAGACDEYGAAGWRLSVFLMLGVFAALELAVPGTPASWLLAAQLAALGAGHALGRLEPVRRTLVAEALVEQRVAERARRAFAENGLTRTRGGTGLLIFVALFERRVTVLADRGIDSVLDPDERWEDVVRLAVDGLRRGRATDGLVAAVARCGEILARHLPAPQRNPDELPNAVVLED